MKGLIIALVLILPMVVDISAQSPQNPCSQPEVKQFHFWIGDWELEWKTPAGETQYGTNQITSILDGCVIQENFNGGDKMPLRGVSLSAYDARAKMWKQT